MTIGFEVCNLSRRGGAPPTIRPVRFLADNMIDLKILKDLPAWKWPEDAGETFIKILRDDRTDVSDRQIAAELAGDFTVINDELANALLSILQDSDEPEEIRGQAAISLGPVLEFADTEGFEDIESLMGLEDVTDVPITEETFRRIQESLRRLYMDAEVPKEVRRRVLEASVRARHDWHQDAVRAAYENDDQTWKLTAVFCMRFIHGFDEQILEALNSNNPDLHYEAVRAAGNWELDAAWDQIAALLTSKKTDKPLLLAAIEAIADIRPREASLLLVDLTDSEDEDIVEAAYEAMVMAEELSDDEDDESLY